MASGQYNYPPPPPPPQAAYPQYQQAPRGGGRGRSRGGNYQGGRGDYHHSPQYLSHAGAYNGQHVVGGGGYAQQNLAPYIGPQVSPPAQSYPPPQWGQPQEPQHPQQNSPYVQTQHQPAPPPVPLSAQNYHPNYAPQVYQQPQPQQQPLYGPQQQFQHSPPPNSYAQHMPSVPQPHPSGPPSQQWQGPSQVPASYNGPSRGRGRGSSHPQGRGGFDAPLMGPPIRMGFDNDRPGEPAPQASNGYPQPYVNGQHHSPPVPFSQPAFQGYSAQNSFNNKGGHHGQGGRPPLDPNPFYSRGSSNHRGRGGFQHRGNKRDFNGDKMRHRNAKNRDSNGPSFQNSGTPTLQKADNIEPVKPSEGKKKKKKKRKTNTLGLTPATEEHEESEEEQDDTMDEDARLAAASDANGRVPEMPTDLSAWLAERRKNWPTKARIEAKQAEQAERRAKAAEQSARDKAKAKKEREERAALVAAEAQKNAKHSGESKLERQQRKAEKLRKQLERAEQKLQEAMKAGTKRKRDEHDTGDDDNGEGVKGIKQENSQIKQEEEDTANQVIALTAATSETDSDSDDSSEYTNATDSDDGPETQTSCQNAASLVPPPSKKTILERQCKYFSTGGTCGKKGKCRFIHDPAVREEAIKEKERNGGRITLAQRLLQNEKEKDDLTVIKSIKYLWDKGFLKEPEPSGSFTGNSETDNSHDQQLVAATPDMYALEPNRHDKI